MAQWEHEVPGRVNTPTAETIGKLWLPEGAHENLTVEHHPLEDGGEFSGGGWKLVWHTTESPWDNEVDAMYRVLRDERFASHIVIGGRARAKRPVAIQMIPFNRAARSLEHPAGTPPTNGADAIQVEICGHASNSNRWPERIYQALAEIAFLIDGQRPIVDKAPVDFAHPHRLTAAQWIRAAGHYGHSMSPNQPQGHTDPGPLPIGHILGLKSKLVPEL